jgi:hypothetical protein
MRKVYPYRTTLDKLTQAYARVEGAGHDVEHCVYVGGRDWVLIVRSDERPDAVGGVAHG